MSFLMLLRACIAVVISVLVPERFTIDAEDTMGAQT